jgi:hypothetical protein
MTMRTAAHIAEVLAGRRVIARGGNYLVRCPAHDDSLPSLSLRDGDRGLLVHCFAGCSAADIFVAIRHIDHGVLEPSDAAPEPVKGSGEYERQQRDLAGWLWSLRRPIVGSINETYVRKVRRYTGPLPPTLAFLPARREHHPAMIAAIALVDEPEPGVLGKPRDVDSVHLTKLRTDGSGKADIDKPKIIIGSPCIDDEKKIARPIVIAPPTDLLGLAITEGIEDALTMHAATGLGAWAAGAADFMPKLAAMVPDYITCITIFAHADKAGQDNARRLAAALRKREPREGERPIEIRMEGL